MSCEAGSRRNLGLVFSKNPPRRLFLKLGDELPPIPGDANNLITAFVPPLDFFSVAGVPNPGDGPDGTPGTGDDGEIAEVEFRIANRENVSALGAFPVTENRPNYCDPGGVPISQVDPNDPETFRYMSTNVRFHFAVGGHKWTLYFGAPHAYLSPATQPTHVDAGPVFVQRVFGTQTPDPTAANPPWEIQAWPWNTLDTAHPRFGLIVGYLYYRGTSNNAPTQYAGAFDIRWADTPATQWTANPL